MPVSGMASRRPASNGVAMRAILQPHPRRKRRADTGHDERGRRAAAPGDDRITLDLPDAPGRHLYRLAAARRHPDGSLRHQQQRRRQSGGDRGLLVAFQRIAEEIDIEHLARRRGEGQADGQAQTALAQVRGRPQHDRRCTRRSSSPALTTAYGFSARQPTRLRPARAGPRTTPWPSVRAMAPSWARRNPGNRSCPGGATAGRQRALGGGAPTDVRGRHRHHAMGDDLGVTGGGGWGVRFGRGLLGQDRQGGRQRDQNAAASSIFREMGKRSTTSNLAMGRCQRGDWMMVREDGGTWQSTGGGAPRRGRCRHTPLTRWSRARLPRS